MRRVLQWVVEAAMREEEINRRLKHKPFAPFRLHLSDGGSHLIDDPDHVLVTRTLVTVGFNADESGIPRETVIVDPIHVTRLTPVVGDSGADPSD